MPNFITKLLFYLAAISMGHAITTFQENYPGFLTYFSGDLVMVLSKEVIAGIEFWEAEVSYLCPILHLNW